jgi:hypothetical protein
MIKITLIVRVKSYGLVGFRCHNEDTASVSISSDLRKQRSRIAESIYDGSFDLDILVTQ